MTPKFDINNKLNFFLAQYFYELETTLNGKAKELTTIKFQSEESNTDEFLKEYIKNIIKLNNKITSSKISALRLTYGTKTKSLSVKEFNKFHITNVLKPAELTNDLKKEIKANKSSVYTNPDLLLEIKGYNKVFYTSIELKSTKNNKIPGSSVQQVNPYEWVIFIKRKGKDVQITTGHYINSITEKLPFPDRSPRPQIGFKTLVDWNKENRTLKNEEFSFAFDEKSNTKKLKMLSDWQGFLAEEWLSILQSTVKTRNEKWFNNTLRKFAIKFLDYSEHLDEKELKALKQRLRDFIN